MLHALELLREWKTVIHNLQAARLLEAFFIYSKLSPKKPLKLRTAIIKYESKEEITFQNLAYQTKKLRQNSNKRTKILTFQVCSNHC